MKWREGKKSNLVTRVRTVRAFAWLPVELNNGDMIWMEMFFQDQVLEDNEQPEGRFPFGIPYWRTLNSYQHGANFWQSIACLFGFHSWKDMLDGYRCRHCPERKAEPFPRYVRDKKTKIQNWPSTTNGKHDPKTDPE